MSAELDQLAAVFADRVIIAREEEVLQSTVRAMLFAEGIAYEEQVKLPGTLGRLDFLVGRVALELKVKGSLADLLRQLDRYAQSDRIDALVVVTTRRTLARLPAELRGKPVRVFVVGAL